MSAVIAQLPQREGILPHSTVREQVHRRRWREIKDRAFKYVMTLGGMAVVLSIAVIFFYLFYVVLPLFQSAQLYAHGQYALPSADAGATAFISTEEYGEIGLRVTQSGSAIFFDTRDGSEIQRHVPEALNHATVVMVTASYQNDNLFGFATQEGNVLLAKAAYQATHPDGKRKITPSWILPYGSLPLALDVQQSQPLRLLTLQGGDDGAMLVGVTGYHRLLALKLSKSAGALGKPAELKEERFEIPLDGAHIKQLLLAPDKRSLYLAYDNGSLDVYDIRKVNDPKLIDHVAAASESAPLTVMTWLSGGNSLLTGDAKGSIKQWFLVRGEGGAASKLTNIRSFAMPQAVTAIAPEYARKAIAATDSGGNLRLFHTTAERSLFNSTPASGAITALAFSPRADRLLLEDNQHRIQNWQVHNEHPEVSMHSLWNKVWYEGRSQPEFIWQSSAATNDFEPKFSLTPLVFGTLKAAFFAMLFAIPLAILGAAYTGYFMAPKLRQVIKPTIELMGALPTVILGFLAGLWLAPLVETRLPGFLLILILLPIVIFCTAYFWSRLPERFRQWLPEGYEAMLLIPVVLATIVLAMALSVPVELMFFDGSMPAWLTEHTGLRYDQRNSLVVGLAMGFAVVPLIFSISEDAINGVPKHLTVGSLALGATPWQTLIRVVLLTASPGIFSAIMIGFGRAVGETMIVLMATGNTPIMNMNMFEGFRALSANTAVEMPESEVGGTHFRILFLASLLLFGITFILNTAAELVRQRLRKQYSSL